VEEKLERKWHAANGFYNPKLCQLWIGLAASPALSNIVLYAPLIRF
jgi:hypothetical protein